MLPTRTVFVFLSVGGLLASLTLPARGDTRLGEPWEEPIQAGVERQERDRKQHQPETLLRQAKLLAARPADDTQKVVRLYLLARAYGIAGDVPAAIATYRDVLHVAPRCYFAYHDMAMLDLQAQPPNPGRAEQSLRRAMGLNPGFLTAQRKLAMLLLTQDRGGEALDVLGRVVDAEPSDLQARYLYAKTLLAQNHLDAAGREIDALVGREPKNATFQDLRAQLRMAQGRYDDALALYKRLATENPTSTAPLSGTLRCLDRKREATQQVDVEAYLWALEGLLRLERDPDRQKHLRDLTEQLRREQTQPRSTGTEGPPSDEVMAERLPSLPPEGRVEILRYVYGREDPPSGALLRTVIGRLKVSAEPDPVARMWALRILGRFGGFGLVGLVRHALGDPAPEVHPVAADVLVDLARTGPAAHGAALLVLGQAATSEDVGLAVAARAGVSALARAQWDEEAGADEAARQQAFRVWWGSPPAAEAKIAALARFPEINDPWPLDVILPYATDPDPYVVAAAWRALGQERERLLREGRVEGDERAWLSRLPPPPPTSASAGAVAASAGVLAGWVAQRPR